MTNESNYKQQLSTQICFSCISIIIVLVECSLPQLHLIYMPPCSHLSLTASSIHSTALAHTVHFTQPHYISAFNLHKIMFA